MILLFYQEILDKIYEKMKQFLKHILLKEIKTFFSRVNKWENKHLFSYLIQFSRIISFKGSIKVFKESNEIDSGILKFVITVSPKL